MIPFDLTMLNILVFSNVACTLRFKFCFQKLNGSYNFEKNLRSAGLVSPLVFRLLCKIIHSTVARTTFPMPHDALKIQCMFLSSSDVIYVFSLNLVRPLTIILVFFIIVADSTSTMKINYDSVSPPPFP